METYIKTLQNASNEAWTVFRVAVTSGKNPKLAFEQLCGRYKDTVADEYIRKYSEICMEELTSVKDAQTYIPEALKATGEMWKVFKANVSKLYGNELTDNDWNRIIKDATDVGYKRWDNQVREYAKKYSCLCVHELDRQYQRLHHIKEDWYKYV